MRSAHIPNRQIKRQLEADLELAADPDISAIADEEAMREERAEVDRLLEQVDRELEQEQATEEFRVSRSLASAQQARQARRRAERVALRNVLLGGQQGKSAAMRFVRAEESAKEGEAA